MSDAQLDPIDDVEESFDEADDSAGQTSEESTSDDKKKKGFGFTIFDAMLLVSLICVSVATAIMFFELRTFGNFPSTFPWRTSEVLEGASSLLMFF